MLSVAPTSVMLIAVFAMFVVAFAVTRMTFLDRQVRRTVFIEPSRGSFVGSGV